jgi:cytochrome P450
VLKVVFLAQEERLWIADPKAMNHVFKNSDALYGKLNSTKEVMALFVDRGLIWADGSAFSKFTLSQILTLAGDVHKRQRRAMTPAFGLVEAKGLLPYFVQSATKVRSCFLSVKHCGGQVFSAAGGKMARINRGLCFRRFVGHRYTFMA